MKSHVNVWAHIFMFEKLWANIIRDKHSSFRFQYGETERHLQSTGKQRSIKERKVTKLLRS